MGVLPPLPRIYFFYASYSSVCISHLGFIPVFVCIDLFVFWQCLSWCFAGVVFVRCLERRRVIVSSWELWVCFPYVSEMNSGVLWLWIIVVCAVRAGCEYRVWEEKRIHEELAVGKGRRRSIWNEERMDVISTSWRAVLDNHKWLRRKQEEEAVYHLEKGYCLFQSESSDDVLRLRAEEDCGFVYIILKWE